MKRLLCGLVAAGLILLLCSCSASDYRAAEQLYAEGSYEAAAEAFSALGDYRDSSERALECRYRNAEQLEASGSYAAAAEAFSALDGYKDSADRASRAAGAEYGDSLIGHWYFSLDSTEELLARLEERMAQWDGLWDLCDYDTYLLTYRLTLFEDGSFSFGLDRDRLNSVADSVIGATREAFHTYFSRLVEDTYRSQGIALEDVYRDLNVADMDGLLRWLNYDPAVMTEKVISRKAFDTAANNAVTTGTWSAGDSLLLFTTESGTDEEQFSLEDGVLTFVGRSAGSTANVFRLGDGYPAVFTRNP
ncbi:MAG: hypothetical protein IKH56_06735 [Oscillospiraceae bacterium]|nr:hypothetical protein [Oscillospiraceae bacterium]